MIRLDHGYCGMANVSRPVLRSKQVANLAAQRSGLHGHCAEPRGTENTADRLRMQDVGWSELQREYGDIVLLPVGLGGTSYLLCGFCADSARALEAEEFTGGGLGFDHAVRDE